MLGVVCQQCCVRLKGTAQSLDVIAWSRLPESHDRKQLHSETNDKFITLHRYFTNWNLIFFQKILFWLAPFELSVLTSNSVHIQKLKQSLHTLKKTPLQALHSLVFVDTCSFRGSVHEKRCKRFPASYAGKTSKNVSLLLLILTAKFAPESAWNTFNAKFVVGSPRNTSSSTQVRRDAGLKFTPWQNVFGDVGSSFKPKVFSFSAAFSCALIKRTFTWPSQNKGVVLKQSKLRCKQLLFRYKRSAEFISEPHCDCQKWKSPGLMAGSQMSWYIVQQRENTKANLEKTKKNERLNWNNFELFCNKRRRSPRWHLLLGVWSINNNN